MTTKISEQIRVAKVFVNTGAGTTDYTGVPITLGKGEVALLESYNVQIGHVADVDENIHAFIWRKSQPKTKTSFILTGIEDDDVLFHERSVLNYATIVGAAMLVKTVYRLLPHPIILIRAPSLVTFSDVGGGTVQLYLYYKILKISDKDMAELMMKDHG